MPELPEVETIRSGLSTLIIGKQITHIEVIDSPKSFPHSAADVEQFVNGADIVAIHRRAKMLLIDLSSRYTLTVHLKMTGQLVFVGKERFGAGHPTDSLIGPLPDRSTRVIITFSDGSHLYFNDQRKFGWIKLVPTDMVSEIPFLQTVGPEPLDKSFTTKDFVKRLRRRNGTSIKAALLDQTVVAGIGNIYADESLWAAKIHPATRVHDLTDTALAQLYKSVRAVLRLSIRKGGSSNKNYVNARGEKGRYIDFAKVYRREGQPCYRHPDVQIEKIRVAGRGTHICPVCQPSPDDMIDT